MVSNLTELTGCTTQDEKSWESEEIWTDGWEEREGKEDDLRPIEGRDVLGSSCYAHLDNNGSVIILRAVDLAERRGFLELRGGKGRASDAIFSKSALELALSSA